MFIGRHNKILPYCEITIRNYSFIDIKSFLIKWLKSGGKVKKFKTFSLDNGKLKISFLML